MTTSISTGSLPELVTKLVFNVARFVQYDNAHIELIGSLKMSATIMCFQSYTF